MFSNLKIDYAVSFAYGLNKLIQTAITKPSKETNIYSKVLILRDTVELMRNK
jgi:hypothetical protein